MLDGLAISYVQWERANGPFAIPAPFTSFTATSNRADPYIRWNGPLILSPTLIVLHSLGGVVASMYDYTPGGPGFESRVGPSLVIESFCIVSLSNSPELGSWRCFTPVPWRARKVVGPAS
ncbi:unnamed protein product, partial [Brenthis ino]